MIERSIDIQKALNEGEYLVNHKFTPKLTEINSGKKFSFTSRHKKIRRPPPSPQKTSRKRPFYRGHNNRIPKQSRLRRQKKGHRHSPPTRHPIHLQNSRVPQK